MNDAMNENITTVVSIRILYRWCCRGGDTTPATPPSLNFRI